ncbi:MAG: heme biosynthesis protein HemY [Gammaproteobacteria bacterium]|nr:MAG: heme biosynthesis protein HemY [Gammaproteobacteria bacterium]
MTRGIVILLLALAIAGGLGALIASDPGYVLVVWGNASLETSLWFGLILLAVLWLLLRTLFAILRAVGAGPGRLQAWQHRRQDRRARDETTKGLLALMEGDWARARKELDVAAALLDNPLVNQLGAARAAHELGDASGCERYLQEALAQNPKATLAVGITRAELQIADQHWEQALATLLSLRKEAPRNGQVLRMLRTVYEALQDWQALAGLLPDLRRAGVMGEEDAAVLERRVWRAELHRSARVDAGPEGRLAALEKAWSRVPKPLRREPELVEVQVRELRDLGAEEAAEELLRATLPSHWKDALVNLYGWVQGAEPETQLAEAEAWLSERPNNPTLLLTLGRLALRHHEWDKAREYLEASVGLRRSAEAEAELGRLLLHLGDHEAAARHFADALREFGIMLPDLPLPEQT